MQKGISLHIGINNVDTSHYFKNDVESWDGQLFGCENDAAAMEQLAKAQGFSTHTLLTKEATREQVKQRIANIAEQLEEGDFFFLTFSGHGGQVADFSGDEAENVTESGKKDKKDETLCLFDGQLLDDELYQLWEKFKKGVRILFLSDSCHSGTIAKGIGDFIPKPPAGTAWRVVPKASLSATYVRHFDFYNSLQSEPNRRFDIQAHIIQISACQDREIAGEKQDVEKPFGYFSKGILKSWDFGGLVDYQDLFDMIQPFMPKKQNPNMIHFGGDEDGRLAFLNSKPLLIN
jgi:hypothetical protein